MEKFAGYGFNKSHSAAYALVSYQTLWLKAHYPAAFMAAVLSADMDNTDKVVTLIDECRSMGLKVEPPAVNRSAFRFTVGGDGSVIYGIGAIKGVGEGAIEAMLAAREAEGPFADLWDFCRRIDLHKANRRVLEAMIRAGALDELGANRATLMAQLPLALKLAEQDKESAAAGQVDLFGALEPLRKSAPDPQIAGEVREDWEEEQRLDGERETLGLYLTGHPINRFDRELGAMVSARIAPMLEAGKDRNDREPRTVAGLVVSVRHGKTQRGRMGSVVLDDRTGRIEVAVFNEVYEQVRGPADPGPHPGGHRGLHLRRVPRQLVPACGPGPHPGGRPRRTGERPGTGPGPQRRAGRGRGPDHRGPGRRPGCLPGQWACRCCSTPSAPVPGGGCAWGRPGGSSPATNSSSACGRSWVPMRCRSSTAVRPLRARAPELERERPRLAVVR